MRRLIPRQHQAILVAPEQVTTSVHAALGAVVPRIPSGQRAAGGDVPALVISVRSRSNASIPAIW
jgi:hypothetical protein